MFCQTVSDPSVFVQVSDRQSYLVVSLVLCLFLGLLLCLQCCRGSSPSPSTNAAALPKSNHYPSPKRFVICLLQVIARYIVLILVINVNILSLARCFSSYDDMSLKRRVTCPLVRSKSFHLCSTEGKNPHPPTPNTHIYTHYAGFPVFLPVVLLPLISSLSNINASADPFWPTAATPAAQLSKFKPRPVLLCSFFGLSSSHSVYESAVWSHTSP